MKKIIKITAALTIFSAVAGFALFYANDLTAPIIEKNQQAGIEAYFNETYDNFASSEFTSVEDENVIGSFDVLDASGTSIGTAIRVLANGYGGQLDIIVAIDQNDTMLGFFVNSHAETPGLGTKIMEEEFQSTLVGQTDKTVERDGVAGASISSAAAYDAIDNAFDYYNQNK